MAQAEVKLETLMSKLQQLDQNLIQRVSDFVDGIFAAQNEEQDWWDDLSAQDHADLKESLEDVEAGREKPMEEVFKKYGL